MKERALASTRMRIMFVAAMVVLAVAPLHGQFMYQELYDFNCSGDGCNPLVFGQLQQWNNDNLYGTTPAITIGAHDDGEIFSATPVISSITIPWAFLGGLDGGLPYAGLSLASDGNLYGTTYAQGYYGYGTIFRCTASGLVPLHEFNGSDGANPLCSPVQARDLNLYGVTGSGSTYRISLGGTFKQLPSTISGYATGYSCPPLVAALDGNLYGVSNSGGSAGLGTLFRMTTSGVVTTLHDFSGATDGANPAGLTLGLDGNLYGTTTSGGTNGNGVIFQFTIPGAKFNRGYHLNPLYSFSALNPTTGQNSDGANPIAGPLADSDGFIYGTTNFGGMNTCGTLFQITTTGIFNKIAEFPDVPCTGQGLVTGMQPTSSLAEHTNGSIYGTTDQGGTIGGNIYVLDRMSFPTYHTVKVAGPIWLQPGGPVQIFGENLSGTTNVTFAGEQTTFQAGSNTFITAQVPTDAIDGPVVVTLVNSAGASEQVQSQQNVRMLPYLTDLSPGIGPVGTAVSISGAGLFAATKVTFGGIKATSFTVVNPALIQAIVPSGAKTGKIAVTTPNGTATSQQKFTVN